MRLWFGGGNRQLHRVREMDITGGTGSLSRAVKEKNTPLRLYLQQKFPNARPIQAAYKSAAGLIAVESDGAPAPTVGTAMDLVVRFLLDSHDVPRSARILLPFAEYEDVIDALSCTAGDAVRDGERGRQEFSQAIWALALCVETHRTGGMSCPLILELFRCGEFDVQTMLSQAPPAGDFVAHYGVRPFANRKAGRSIDNSAEENGQVQA
jgi:hypothetical protein